MKRFARTYEFAVVLGFLGGMLAGGGLIGSVYEPSQILSIPVGLLMLAAAIGHIGVARRREGR